MVLHVALSVGSSVQLVIVYDYQLPVLCELNVQLYEVRAAVQSRLKCRHGILGSLSRKASVRRHMSTGDYAHVKIDISAVQRLEVGQIHNDGRRKEHSRNSSLSAPVELLLV